MGMGDFANDLFGCRIQDMDCFFAGSIAEMSIDEKLIER
jgi:hypothetical protein